MLKERKVREATTDGVGNFISAIVEGDLDTGRRDEVVTRFPPEPNGYLHIGHAKSICLNFGLARDFGGRCHLRFDDTNPETEDMEYVESIKRDVHWLGFDWGEHEYYASDYFEQLYAWAVQLVRNGRAYVDDLSEEDIRAYRGTVTEPGRESPYRDREPEENLDLLERMRRGEFPNGSKVVRAKIDMASPNMKMRDPLMYRIRHATHYRRGDDWCIYPMYDWAHGQSDAIEDISHSICTLEFESNRELYDWFLDSLGVQPRPYQYEFARLALDYTVLSKRKLIQLVQDGHVNGWDDPRLPTMAGLRRRGVPPEALRDFCDRIGVAKANSRVDIGLLEYSIRDHLNMVAPRVMCVLRPLRVVITNYPKDQVEWLDAPYYPHDVPLEGTRKIPFSGELFIERADFMESPPKKYHRLAPGREVRLRYGYFVTCTDVVRDSDGNVSAIHCTYDPTTRGGDAPDGRTVRGTIHWVSAAHALRAEARLYDRLFRVENPDEGPEDFTNYLNPDSFVVLPDARVEPSVAEDDSATRYQFERLGYFWRDGIDSTKERPVFNRIVTLRDSWAKIVQKKQTARASKPVEGAASGRGVAERETASSGTSKPRDVPANRIATMTAYVDNLSVPDAEARVLATDPTLGMLFEEAIAEYANPPAVAKWLVNDFAGVVPDEMRSALPFSGSAIGRLVRLIVDDVISSRTAKDVLTQMLDTGDDPKEIVARDGLAQMSDVSALSHVVHDIVAEFPDRVTAYRSGKTGLIGFFVGQVMQKTGGTANPQIVQELLRAELDASPTR